MSRKKFQDFLNFEEIIERFRDFTGLKSKKQIAELFKIGQNEFSNMKKTGGLIPFFIEHGIQHNLNLNWLFTGKGKMLVTEEIPQQKEVVVDYTKYFDQLLEAQKEIAELRLRLQRYEDHPMQTRTQKGSRLVG